MVYILYRRGSKLIIFLNQTWKITNSFIPSLIHKYLSSMYHVPDTVSARRDRVVNKNT